MMIFYFYLSCFNFSISYSVLPFHLLYIFQFHISFVVVVLSQALASLVEKLVCMCVCVCVMCILYIYELP